ncbi:uncharacterized protein LOC117287726 [Asterias rubens]|uniref:uncharacterized protein LOC117287726 n=1 Tax=Asterias rubens TaxID=7604 RepID=UPI001455424C|nr:uncharacterized protein LOC117287726 [Asterias rubens]
MAPVFRVFKLTCLMVVAFSLTSCLTHEEILQQHAKLQGKIHKAPPKPVVIEKPVFRTNPDELKSNDDEKLPLDKQEAPSDNLKSGGGRSTVVDTDGDNPSLKPDQEDIFIDDDETEDAGGLPLKFPDPDLDEEDGGRDEEVQGELLGDKAEDEIHHEEDVDEEAHFQEQYRGEPQDAPVGTLVLEDLEEIISSQERILLHFVGEDCKKCDLFRPHFAAAAKTFWDMEETDNSQVVLFYEVTDLQLMVKFNLRQLPTVFFFRSGIPILYEGTLTKEPLVSWMLAHLEVMGWELQEDNFDLETKRKNEDGTSQQWLINFCNVDIAGCDGFMATWESAAYSLNGTVQFGYVDIALEVTLAKRFDVDPQHLPAVALLKDDQIFWCTLPLMELTTHNLIHFVTSGHMKNDEEHLPSQLSAFAALIVRAGAHFNVVLATMVATTVVLYVIYVYVCRRQRLADSGKQKGV